MERYNFNIIEKRWQRFWDENQTYKTSLPGAPDGEYVVMEFTTAFTNKKSAIETITPMLDEDGQWRVAGYYIR